MFERRTRFDAVGAYMVDSPDPAPSLSGIEGSLDQIVDFLERRKLESN